MIDPEYARHSMQRRFDTATPETGDREHPWLQTRAEYVRDPRDDMTEGVFLCVLGLAAALGSSVSGRYHLIVDSSGSENGRSAAAAYVAWAVVWLCAAVSCTYQSVGVAWGGDDVRPSFTANACFGAAHLLCAFWSRIRADHWALPVLGIAACAALAGVALAGGWRGTISAVQVVFVATPGALLAGWLCMVTALHPGWPVSLACGKQPNMAASLNVYIAAFALIALALAFPNPLLPVPSILALVQTTQVWKQGFANVVGLVSMLSVVVCVALVATGVYK